MELTGFTTSTRKEPDWFRIGRDAARVMERLGGIRELEFYLRHPEPFIRLHAIRRVAHLLLPDAIAALSRMLDDPLENDQNRDEAGWAIRRICRAKKLNWFAGNTWADRYDGTEPAAERYGVTLVDTGETVAETFAESDREEPLLADEVLLRIQMEEKDLPLGFSPLPWLARNGRHLLLALLKGLGHSMLRFFRKILKGCAGLALLMKNGLFFVFQALKNRQHQKKTVMQTAPAIQTVPAIPVIQTGILASGRAPVMLIGAEEAGLPATAGGAPIAWVPDTAAIVQSSPASSVSTSSVSTSSVSMSSTSRSGVLMGGNFPGLSIRSHSSGKFHHRRKGGGSMFRLLFYPVRLVRQHWVFTLGVLAAFYLVLSFSHPGRSFVRDLNPHAQFANDRLVAATRALVANFLGISTSEDSGRTQEDAAAASFADATSLSMASGNDPQTASPIRSAQARVTAPKGLNLRNSPSPTGEKIVWMQMDTTVVLLGETTTDSSGDLWQSVRLSDKTGWAMDKWLSTLPEEE